MVYRTVRYVRSLCKLAGMKYYNAARAAMIVDRSERTIRRHLKAGLLPARKTHHGWLIAQDELLKFYGPDSPDKPDTSPDVPDSPASLVQHVERVKVTQGATGGGDFKTHAEAARWLVLHGIHSEGTPKSWQGWRRTPLRRADVLALAIRLGSAKNHRINWTLVKCGDVSCVCDQMLGER